MARALMSNVNVQVLSFRLYLLVQDAIDISVLFREPRLLI